PLRNANVQQVQTLCKGVFLRQSILSLQSKIRYMADLAPENRDMRSQDRDQVANERCLLFWLQALLHGSWDEGCFLVDVINIFYPYFGGVELPDHHQATSIKEAEQRV